MYRPRLKYVFCLTRIRTLTISNISLMRYMNSVGIVPQLLINGWEFGYNQYLLITKELNQYKIKYKEVKNLSDCDILFCEGPGQCPFEIHWQKENKRRNKFNVILMNSLAGWKNHPIPSFFPARTKLLDGICMKIGDNILHYKEFTEGLFLLNVGDPDWDWWQTNEFKKEVDKVKLHFGNKILVLCETFAIPEAIPYTELCIKQAKDLGWKFIINYHPDRWNLVPKQFYKYCNKSIHHHILFSASSHLIGSIGSSVIIENLFLGTKTGSNAAIYHYKEIWGKHVWLNKDIWTIEVRKHVEQEIIDMVPLVFDEKDMNSFLLLKHIPSPEVAGEALGKINVPCYSEYLFKTLDERCKR